MYKTGLVLKVERNKATLLTDTGEFVKVGFSKTLPKVGETYSGSVEIERNYLKHLAAVAALFMIFLSGGGVAYAYYTPVATIQVSINPSIELKINRFDKIIKSTPINTDGVTLLQNLQLKNKNVNEALTLVVNKAKKDNFINEDYNTQGKTISVKISAKDNVKTIKLEAFQKYIAQNKINTKIDDNGKKTNQEFTKVDKSINKQAPTGSNSLNKNKVKPIEGDNKSKNDNLESKPKENEVPKNLPGSINHDKRYDKSVEDKVESSKLKKYFDNKN